ncbi:ArsR/SmtB family transcription factor [Streptomyces sp. G45]|uniref:ArsR/SmtB family transcription factor n=1 Tax=Streptomyces sp. G45 TaxID=3406627 RepID=UPI003C1EC83B
MPEEPRTTEEPRPTEGPRTPEEPNATEEPNAAEAAGPQGRGAARKIVDLDARSLRGLAHPLRMRLLASLRLEGPATASQLAARLGESSGATSYHLRQLATYGFVEDDPERGKGRERWWRSKHDGTRMETTLMRDPDPSVRGAYNELLHYHVTLHAEEASTWVGTQGEWSREWQDSADLSDYTLRLTPARTEELGKRIHQLIESYRELEADKGNPDAARVRVHSHVFPTHPTT